MSAPRRVLVGSLRKPFTCLWPPPAEGTEGARPRRVRCAYSVTPDLPAPLHPAGGVTLPPRLSRTDQWWLFSCLQQLWCQPADGDPCAHRLRSGETRVHRPAGQARSPAAFTSLGKQVSGLRPWQRDYLSTELMNLGVLSPHRTVLCPRPFA